MNTTTAPDPLTSATARVSALENVIRALLNDVVPHTRDTGHNAADREMSQAILSARAAVPDRNVAKDTVTWPKEPGWYWAFGRVAGMREATLMSARAVMEGSQLIVYVGDAMTNRLSFPDPELPLKFKPAALPKF